MLDFLGAVLSLPESLSLSFDFLGGGFFFLGSDFFGSGFFGSGFFGSFFGSGFFSGPLIPFSRAISSGGTGGMT